MKVGKYDVSKYRKCQGRGCDELVLPPRRKCNRCRKPRGYTIMTLRPSNRGRNAHNGLSLAHPTDSRVKRPGRAVPENQYPSIRTSNWEFV